MLCYKIIRKHAIKAPFLVIALIAALTVFSKYHEKDTNKEDLEDVNPMFAAYQSKGDRMTSLVYEVPSYLNVDPPKSAFRVSGTILRELATPPPYVTLNSQNVKEFVFITGANSPFYEECLKTIERIQEHFPQHKIIFYDLGMKPEEQQQISKICRLTYKFFDFHRYPTHVHDLHTYAWKPIAIYETLREYPGVFWVDTSARFSGSSDVIYDEVIRNNGALYFTTTGHSNFAVTHERTYDFLPTNLEAMLEMEQRESGLTLYYRTKFTYENIVFWMVICALEKECIAPIKNRSCRFVEGPKRFSTYAKCHRFDQSALNILMANAHNFPEGNQLYASVRIVYVDRWDEVHPTHVQYCDNESHTPPR